jgi:hypothetical protein
MNPIKLHPDGMSIGIGIKMASKSFLDGHAKPLGWLLDRLPASPSRNGLAMASWSTKRGSGQ